MHKEINLEISMIESSVIGGILIDNKRLVDAIELIDPSDFEYPPYAKVFEAMIEFDSAKKPFDLLLLNEYLVAKKEMPAVNILSLLAEAMNTTPTSKYVSHYAKLVKENSVRKKLNNKLTKIADLNVSKQPLPKLLNEAKQTMEALESDITPASENSMNVEAIISLIINEIENAEDGITPKKLNTGYEALDKILVGLRPGNLVIIAARPSVGKTTFALNIAKFWTYIQQKRVMIFSFEMNEMEIMRSMIAMAGQISLQHVKGENVKSLDWDKISKTMHMLSACKIYIHTNGSNIENVIKLSREYKAANPDLEAIFIDYLQLMSAKGWENRNLELGYITRELKLLAGELQIPIIALSQLNRPKQGGEHVAPTLTMLRDSGSIEQDADIVMFVHREEAETKIIVGKNRSGPCGEARLIFDGEKATFKSAEQF